MKRLLILLCALCVMASCNRGTCPAYMDGAVTGTEGSRGKAKQLFPESMVKKKKKH
ncbi:MAG: hypothetical protein ABIQ74_12105 [Chitinophagales bacterium]